MFLTAWPVIGRRDASYVPLTMCWTGVMAEPPPHQRGPRVIKVIRRTVLQTACQTRWQNPKAKPELPSDGFAHSFAEKLAPQIHFLQNVQFPKFPGHNRGVNPTKSADRESAVSIWAVDHRNSVERPTSHQIVGSGSFCFPLPRRFPKKVARILQRLCKGIGGMGRE